MTHRQDLIARMVDSMVENMQDHERSEPIMEEVLIGLDDQTKITDVNQFCLEHIFTYLDLKDLLNVADANKNLKLATFTPFSRKYGWKTIDLRQTGKYIYVETIQDLKTIFQLLRCFGCLISKMKILYYKLYNNQNFENYNRIMDYVNEFCAESLINIDIYPAVGFSQLKRPFVNVEELRITESFLQEKCLGRMFPKLRSLIFSIPSLTLDFGPIIRDYFPHLEHFEFDFANSCKYAAVDTLRFNSHVKSLRIGIPSFSFLHEISDYLQNVEILDIYIRLVPWNKTQFKSNPIYFRNVKRFSIQLYNVTETIVLPKLPFVFDQLKEFELYSNLEYSDFYNDFLKENPTIEKLTLDYERLSKNGITNPEKLQKMLPFLKEINLSNIFYSMDSILNHWTNDLKTVERFSFTCGNTIEEIKNVPLNEWHVIVSLESGLFQVVTLERNEALTHNTPFSIFNNRYSARFNSPNEFLFCNCNYKIKHSNPND